MAKTVIVRVENVKKKNVDIANEEEVKMKNQYSKIHKEQSEIMTVNEKSQKGKKKAMPVKFDEGHKSKTKG